MKIDEEKHKAVMMSLTELIQSVVASDEPGRFLVVGRLSGIATKLQRELAARVADFPENDGLGYDIEGGGMVRVGGGAVFPMGAHNQGQDMVRGLMEQLAPYFSAQTASHDASVRSSRASELEMLSRTYETIKDLLPKEAAELKSQIERLVQKYKEENDDEMVPADVLGRHPVGVEVEGGNPGGVPDPDAIGKNSDAGAPQEGPEAFVGRRPALG